MFITIAVINTVTSHDQPGTRSDNMNITILGAGNMGSALAKQFSRAGHKVRITSRNAEKARAVVAASPGAVIANAADAVADANVVIVATGFADAIPALKSA